MNSPRSDLVRPADRNEVSSLSHDEHDTRRPDRWVRLGIYRVDDLFQTATLFQSSRKHIDVIAIAHHQLAVGPSST